MKVDFRECFNPATTTYKICTVLPPNESPTI